jgi:signal transduction histidine kinase
MRGGVLTGVSPADRPILRSSIRTQRILLNGEFKIKLEQLAAVVLARTPMGALVRWVAGIRASLHAKLMGAFLVVTLLFIVMAVFSVLTVLKTAQQSRQLDQAHQRVAWSQQIEQALARQMHFSVLALLSQDEAAIGKILRENNRFNETLAKLDAAGLPDQHNLVEQVRVSQDEAMSVVADMANAIRDGNLGNVTRDLLAHQERIDVEITARVSNLVNAEQTRMAKLRDSIASANRESLITTATLSVIAVVLAWVCGFVIAWSFIGPVRQAQGFLTLVAAGDFSQRIEVRNRDEFGALAKRMNHMSMELERLDHTRRDAADELTRLNARLEHASRAKSEFLANMSHELRTPLNAILGFTEMMVDELYGELPHELKEPLNDVQVNGKHLLRLINDVLDLAKIESGRMELALRDYSVQEMIASVRTSLRSLAKEKGLDLGTDVPDDLPPARGDGGRLMQCLMNLTGNALKFTPRGTVCIGVALKGDELIYRVSDTGIGIPPEELQNVFAEFRQVDSTVTRRFGGTGLGLSISKKFVEMHGGRIWVETKVGHGSTFFFSVPLRVGESPSWTSAPSST